MDYKEENTKDSRHPLQFALWVIAVMLLLIGGIHTLMKPFHFGHPHTLLFVAQKAPWETYTVKSGDNLQKIFDRAGLLPNEYYRTIKLKNAYTYLKNLKPKQTIYLLVNKDASLKKLLYKINNLKYLDINYEKKPAPVVTIVTQKSEKKIQTAEGTIQYSFSNAANKAGLPSNLIAAFADIFSWEVSFDHQIQPGDKFALIYDQDYINGKPSGSSDILAAEFITKNKTYQAIRYQEKDGTVGYFTPLGANLAHTFLRAPIHYKYVSSPFNSKRMHPILHIIRPHEGVDLAASTGTPIDSAADGIIEFRGRRGGYGKAIVIEHGHGYSTLYAHMSKFSSRFHVGSRIRRGQVIGYVGQTGLATGPHLHYEFRRYGVHYNPMTVRLPHANPIPKSEKEKFQAYAQKMVDKLNHINIT